MSSINPFTLRRLLLSKNMFLQASMLRLNGSEISRMMACHHLDMAVELVLKTIITHLNPQFNVRNIKFLKLWQETDQSFQSIYSLSLPYETEMMRLRDSRNKVQHDGSLPDSVDLIQFETSVKIFLDEVLNKVFSVNLEDFFLSEIIRDKRMKKWMKEAEIHLNGNNFDKSVEKSSAAFEYGFTAKLRETEVSRNFFYIPRIQSIFTNSSTSFFDFSSRIGGLDNLGTDLRELKNWLEELTDEFNKLGEVVLREFELLKSINNVLMVGLNYLEYDKFKKAAFHINIDQDGSYSASRLQEKRNTEDEALFCLNFVFNALSLWGL